MGPKQMLILGQENSYSRYISQTRTGDIEQRSDTVSKVPFLSTIVLRNTEQQLTF